MLFKDTYLKGAYIIDVELFEDKRGYFTRVFCAKEFERVGIKKNFVQTNHSASFGIGLIRGFHYQLPPFGEAKLVKCIRGSIYDVIIDVRKDSSTFLQWYGVELSEENKRMLYVPEGFAHGFQTLTDNVETIYQVTGYYNPESERCIRYDDPRVKVQWKLDVTKISEKDANIPLLESSFEGV